MTEKEKRLVYNASLIPGVNISQFVVQKLLEGIEVKVEINGTFCTGYVHQLDFSKGSDYVFANVWIQDPDNENEHISLRVSIHMDGTVNIMPDQPEDE